MNERHNNQQPILSTSALGAEVAEAAFALGALSTTIAATLFAHAADAGANLHLTAVILSQLVCVMNFRSWKMFVSVFLSASAPEGRTPAARVQTYKRFAAALMMKTVALLAAVVFVLREGAPGLVWFMAGFSAYIILGLVFLAAAHLVLPKRQ